MITTSFITYFNTSTKKFRVEDTTNYQIQGIDPVNVKGVLKLTSPRGVTYNNTTWASPDIQPSTSVYSTWIALPTNQSGYILAGTYKVQYSIQILGVADAVLETTYTYSFVVPAITITQDGDGYNSTFQSIDSSIYGSYTSLTRTHTVTPPSGSGLPVTSNSSVTITYAANIWSGEWTTQITSVLVYTQIDGLVINCTITDTDTLNVYNVNMNAIRGYIETMRLRYVTALTNDRDLAYRLKDKLLLIDAAYTLYDLALVYNDLEAAYDQGVNIILQLSDYVTITTEVIIPFSQQQGTSHVPVSINPAYAYGSTIDATTQVIAFALASASHGGMMPQLSGNSTDYLGGDNAFHALPGGGDAMKSDFASYVTVTAITTANALNWNTAYGWGNHASAGYAVATNYYTKTNVQTSGQASIHWGNLTNKPTTLTGYGITDGMIGNAAIIAATKCKISYDTKGLVLAGNDLSASDIPNLAWSKITSGVPTTIAGYGITDAYTKTEVDNKTWAWTAITSTPTTLATYGITDAYTKVETDALNWAWTDITSGVPTTVAGYGITDAITTAHAANKVIDTGVGSLFLADDGTYKSVSLTGVADRQIVFSNGSTFAGSNDFIFDSVTSTVYLNNLVVDVCQIDTEINFTGVESTSGSGSGFRGWSDVSIKRVADNLIFEDRYNYKSLSQLASASAQYWNINGSDIYYGVTTDTKKVGINQENPTAELEVKGHIIADYFDSSYIRYKNSNILIGPNAGDNETGSDLLYIANTNTSSPLIQGDFINQTLEFNADVYIKTIKRLCFDDSDVYIRRDTTTDDLLLCDLNTNGGSPVKLSDLYNVGTYALVTDFTQYAAVTSITNTNKTTWNKSSVLTTSGAGTLYLDDSGNYTTPGSSGVTPTDYTWKFDGSGIYYRPYNSKTEAGGVASAGKFYGGTSNPSATNRLNYDGYLYGTKFYSASNEVLSSAVNGLTKTDGEVALGGTLTTYTSINGAYGFDIGLVTPISWFAVNTAVNTGGVDVQFSTDNFIFSLGYSDVAKSNIFTDQRVSPAGIEYGGDYSATYTSRSIVDKGYIVSYAEPVLGNPASDGYILSSTAAGVRSWVVKPTSFPGFGTDHSTTAYGDHTHSYLTDAPSDGTNYGRKNGAWEAITGSVTLVDDILDWSTNKYTPYAAQQGSLSFDTSSTTPTLTTRLNLNGAFHATSGYFGNTSTAGTCLTAIDLTKSLSSIGTLIQSYRGITLSVTQTGDNTGYGHVTSNVINITRTVRTDDLNISGNIINIVDNPTVTSGPISGAVLSATMGVTERLNLSPRIAATGGVAYTLDTHNALTTSNILDLKNQGTSKSYITSSGKNLYTAGTSSTFVIVPGVLKDFYTDAVTSGTGETDLYTYTVPANVLATNGDKLTAEYTVDLATSASILTTYFAGSLIYAFTGLSNDAYLFVIKVVRVSLTVARVTVSCSAADSYTIGLFTYYTELTSKDWTTTNIIKITGTAPSGTITARMGCIEYKPAAIN